MELRDSIRSFPTAPGVYLMRDATGTILYVGKARNLRQRVSNYFGATDGRPQVRFLMARVTSIEFTITDTEKEALLLENTLIKQHQPRYNLNLKDDKTFFSLRIDLTERFPRFTVVRKVSRDGARYFGPYASASAAREVLRQLQRMFPLRHYPLKTCLNRSRPCLYHQIGQCSAPCHNLITAEEYNLLVEGAVLFLEGKNKDLVSGFRQRMKEAAEGLHYEEAARWRDLLKAIDTTLEHQKMVSQGGDSDILGLAGNEDSLAIAVLFVRGGSLSGSTVLHGSGGLDTSDTLATFIQYYYGNERFIPDELLLPLSLDAGQSLEEWLSELKGKKVRLQQPKRGDKLNLVNLATRNAQAALAEKSATRQGIERTLAELQQKLALPRLPRRIECYDISTLQGRHSVGSGVAFLDGLPDKERYRRYRIRESQGQDDFGMLQEVFARRFSPERIEQWGLPDLVVVDGGIGQLNSTLSVLAELGLSERPAVVSLAKSRVKGDGKDIHVERTEERVFLPGRRNPVRLRQDSAPLKLLAAIRDEAHRFAIGYHRRLRDRETLRSALREIPGVGPKLERLLLTRFGSLEGIQNATVEELATVAGVSQELARLIKA
ncbi:excinuclease ABC subunit UvrC [Trichlorobacter lovleyi]|uniref:UvrABC system protein C n=1 Tax=Trichlorobacter lovleyi (strain ATCC BAA-1151 / DSM 17278 / SZ) TaxID=398767 RepID=UVRC_TRIL1|nr:excinuclease ABC subunit UvrC [Trichlorobacter lovleyi]B3E394.1 RecName: Full=UvrABC system protein C; Short=Protein UvrC; AltName: Full=Excinuclease ABC subunit C [Trichlorobacter lovleyi SZ]ACD94306.1 excinuclease ABC, C subunit [Trichlorobacter lovleyi SZ]